jgi:hypothetical protein
MGNNGISGLGGVKVNVSGYGMMVLSENKGDKLIYIGWDMVFSMYTVPLQLRGSCAVLYLAE